MGRVFACVLLPFLASSQGPGNAARASEAPPPKAAAPETPLVAGQDFTREARLLFRVVACAGAGEIPVELEAVVKAHCAAFRPLMAAYREKYVQGAQSFLQSLQPDGLPATVVYPFGGGDLLSALTTYQNLREVTTLSLEHSGDPRRIVGIDAPRLEESLLRVRKGISGLLWLSDSTSENLMQLQRGDIPGQLAFFLIGLAIHGQEPIGLRYFRIEADGSLHYLEQQDIAALEDQAAQQLNAVWKSPDFSVAFSNSELSFRAEGARETRMHRHIAANLMDGPLAKSSGVLKHLGKKGRVAAMTKAASYVLWSKGFTRIRNYLLANMDFMLSDSTGIPPQYASAAGFEQETYGKFDGPFLEANAKDAEDFCALWSSQPKRDLTFRYGYVDVLRQNHLLVTRRTPQR
jgi:hypothetical protein